MQLVLKSTEICNVRYVLESCIKNIYNIYGYTTYSIFDLPTTQGCGLFHSYGEKRAITNRVKETST